MTLLGQYQWHYFCPYEGSHEDEFGRLQCRECDAWDWKVKPQGSNHKELAKPEGEV